MAELHDALSYLGPISWEDDVPVSSSEQLRAFAQGIFSKSKLIIETVPEQIPSSDDDDDNNNNNNNSISDSNSKNDGDGSNNDAAEQDEFGLSTAQFEMLRKEWGKPLRMNNSKENPLNIPMYKLSGKDGKGAWFARRSIHKGLPFARWKVKMQAEIEETLKERQGEKQQGKTPESSVRGIGADSKLEHVDIGSDADLGSIDVYKLSAQFPGPTTARDFVTMIMSTHSLPLRDQRGELGDASSLLVVSKPCIHPEAPPRDDYVRGQYESVELIRQVPATSSQKGKRNGRATTDSDSPKPASRSPRSISSANSTEDANNPNLVEWIMVTRSDPGGSVPRWMVERGTPKSITGDAVKFLNWASQPDASDDQQGTVDIGEMTKDAETRPDSKPRADRSLSGNEGTSVISRQSDAVGTDDKKSTEEPDQTASDSRNIDTANSQTANGLWNSVTSLLSNGLGNYAPQAVVNYIPNRDSKNNITSTQDGGGGGGGGGGGDDDSTSAASYESFTSAESRIPGSILDSPTDSSTTKGQSRSSSGPANAEHEAKAEIMVSASKDAHAKPSSKEKDLAKLQARKREVEAQITTIQSEIESLGGKAMAKGAETSDYESGRISGSTSTSTATLDKTVADPKTIVQNQKRVAHLLRKEAKLNSQLNKMEAQQVKLVKKIEANQARATEREKKARSKAEVESLRKEVQSLKEEVRELRGERAKWLDIIGKLQKENVELSEKLGQSNKDD